MYKVVTIRNNGYRCSCCRQTYTETALFTTKEAALALVPTTIPKRDEDEDWLSGELEFIEVYNEDPEAQPTLLACGTLTYPLGHRQTRQAERWRGYKSGFGDFDDIDYGSYKDRAQSWKHLLLLLEESWIKSKLEAAEAALKTATKDQAFWSSCLAENAKAIKDLLDEKM